MVEAINATAVESQLGRQVDLDEVAGRDALGRFDAQVGRRVDDCGRVQREVSQRKVR